MTELEKIKSEMTPRVFEAFRCFARGLSADEVAAEMGIAPTTARTYRTELYDKLGLTHSKVPNAKLVYLALRVLGMEV